MIPITIVTTVESIPNLISQVDLLNFSLGDIVGAIALVVSAYTFYISHTQATQSEQIKTSRDIWAKILDYSNKIPKNHHIDSSPEGVENLMALLLELDYFSYLILRGEIRDKVVLGYYRNRLSELIKNALVAYFLVKGKKVELIFSDKLKTMKLDLGSLFPSIDELIDKWEMHYIYDELKRIDFE